MPSWIENPSKSNQELTPRAKKVAAAAAALVLGATLVGKEITRDVGYSQGPEETYIIKSGDTEWGLAGKINSNIDPREVVAEIDKVLPSDAAHENHTLQPGDKVHYQDGKVTGFVEGS
jgi:hypothetical protein